MMVIWGYNPKDAIARGAGEKDMLKGINTAAFDILLGKAIGAGMTEAGKTKQPGCW
jgi:hypothetical protein